MSTSSFSFSRWAVYAHKDDTGFGRMASDLRSILGLGHHLVIPSERLTDYPLNEAGERWFPKDAPLEMVHELLRGLEGIIFFERPNWHPQVLRIAHEMGVSTVCVPMWEWFNGAAEEWRYCDLFACPARYAEQVVRSYGYQNTVQITWPLDLMKLPFRRIAGPARHFVHNAGLVDHDDRKGTGDTIRAFRRIKRQDVRLTVTLQKEVPLPLGDDRVEIVIGNLNPKHLYATGDICVQPSKMEGIGFMVLEPACAGLPVITTDYPPMNEFIQQPELRCRTRWRERKAFPTNWIPHAHLKLPSIRDLTRKMEWAASHDLAPISQANRAWAERTFDRQTLLQEWSSSLSTL